MQPQIHKEGAAAAEAFAARVEASGLKDKFNTDPDVSVREFPLPADFAWLDLSVESNKLQYANLVRMCVHFELETLSFFQVMGFDPSAAFPTTVDTFMGQNTVDSLKDTFPNVGTAQFRLLARHIAKAVYAHLSEPLSLPTINWPY